MAEMKSPFTIKRDEVAENLYHSLLKNYSDIPEEFIKEKDMILEILRLAWVNGANWRVSEMVQTGRFKTGDNKW